jgi:hypothetical protein
MKCRPLIAGDKVVGFVCGSRDRCKVCVKPSSKLCDFPVLRDGVWRTCSVKLCSRHAVRIGPDLDLCEPHYAIVEKFDPATTEAAPELAKRIMELMPIRPPTA